jgi:hypothetical protein
MVSGYLSITPVLDSSLTVFHRFNASDLIMLKESLGQSIQQSLFRRICSRPSSGEMSIEKRTVFRP